MPTLRALREVVRCQCEECDDCPNPFRYRVTRDYGKRLSVCVCCTFTSDSNVIDLDPPDDGDE